MRTGTCANLKGRESEKGARVITPQHPLEGVAPQAAAPFAAPLQSDSLPSVLGRWSEFTLCHARWEGHRPPGSEHGSCVFPLYS